VATDGSPDARLLAELPDDTPATWTPVLPAEWLPTLPDAPAQVNADSVPPGAEVYVNRHLKGITPCSFAVTSAEQHLKPYTVSSVKEFLRIEERELCLRRGQNIHLSVSLAAPLTRPNAPDELKRVRNAVRQAVIHRDAKLLASVVSPRGLLYRRVLDGFEPHLLSREQVASEGTGLVWTEFFHSFRDEFLWGRAVDAPGGEAGEGWHFQYAGRIRILQEHDGWWLWGFNAIGWGK